MSATASESGSASEYREIARRVSRNDCGETLARTDSARAIASLVRWRRPSDWAWRRTPSVDSSAHSANTRPASSGNPRSSTIRADITIRLLFASVRRASGSSALITPATVSESPFACATLATRRSVSGPSGETCRRFSSQSSAPGISPSSRHISTSTVNIAELPSADRASSPMLRIDWGRSDGTSVARAFSRNSFSSTFRGRRSDRISRTCSPRRQLDGSLRRRRSVASSAMSSSACFPSSSRLRARRAIACWNSR